MTRPLVHITEWDAIGRGVGECLRHDGTCFRVAVPGSILGETVEVDDLVKNPKGVPRWVAREMCVTRPSPHRVSPRCPHAGECGGCTWQHMAYEHQLEVKQESIEQLFTPLCSRSLVRPILGCENPWQYRNKMEFSFSQDMEGRPFLGLFYGQRRHRVLDLQVCCLTGEWMSTTLHAIREWWKASALGAYRPSTNSGSLICVTMRQSATLGDRMVILTVSGNPEYALKQHHLNDFVDVIRKEAAPPVGELSIVLRIRQIAPKRPTQLYEMLLFGPDHIREKLDVQVRPDQRCSLEFHISPQAFFQPNTRQAMHLYSQALQMADITPDSVVVDLYCGIGVFGMFAVAAGGTAVGVELSEDAAYDAKTNAQRLGLSRYAIHCGDTAESVARMKQAECFAPPTSVIVDPPRAGLLPKAIDEIVALNPPRIVYVSCNPHTQVVDAARFVEQGWAVDAVQPVDQFPHTAHVENILLLTRG